WWKRIWRLSRGPARITDARQPRTLSTTLLLAALDPILHHHLPPPGDRQTVRGNILGDGGAGTHVSSAVHLHRRYELAVASNKHIVLEDGLVLLLSVVVAGDGPGPHVDPCADLRVTQVSQVIRLAPAPDLALLGLHEISDPHLFSQVGLGPQMGERPHPHAPAQTRLADDAVIQHLHPVREGRAHDSGPGTDPAPFANNRVPLQNRAGVEQRIPADLHIGIDIGAIRIHYRDASIH